MPSYWQMVEDEGEEKTSGVNVGVCVEGRFK